MINRSLRIFKILKFFVLLIFCLQKNGEYLAGRSWKNNRTKERTWKEKKVKKINRRLQQNHGRKKVSKKRKGKEKNFTKLGKGNNRKGKLDLEDSTQRNLLEIASK